MKTHLLHDLEKTNKFGPLKPNVPWKGYSVSASEQKVNFFKL